MRKNLTFLIFTVFIVSFVFGQNKVTNDNDYGSSNTPIDNIGHWMEMMKRGIVPKNPTIPVKPATERSSKVYTSKGLQNSTDVVLLDETDVTQSENSIFIDPNDRGHALNSNNSNESGSFYGANYLLTDDSGLTWSGSKQGAGGGNMGDPAACIGLNGRHYIGAINSSRKQVVSYSDNGTAWTQVDVVSGTFSYPDLLDKNHLWIDNTNSGYEGNLYDAWTHFESGHANNKEIEFSRSTDDGLSWSTPINISSGVAAGNHNQGVNIQCNNTGWVFTVWAIYDDWTGVYPEDAIGFARSGNGGSSFSGATRIVDNINGIRSNPNNPTSNATGKSMRVNSFPSMAIDVSGGPYHGDLYVVWANQGVPGTNTGTNVSIYLTKSTSGGINWTTPTRINTVAEADHAAFFPWITCDPITGNLYVVFYDDRNFTDASSEVETWVAFSEDGGATWEDMAVSDVSFTPSPIPGMAGGYFGDYLGISAYNGKVYPTWADNRSGRALTYVSPLDFGCNASGGGSEHIARVQFGSIDNTSGSNEYSDYTYISNELPLNVTEDITVTNGVTSYSGDQCGIWVDWNRDDDFDDPGETISVSGTPGYGPYTASIAPPVGTTVGDCLMRIRITWTGDVEPCGVTDYGEVEDYTITVAPDAPNEWIGAFNHFWHNNSNWSLGHIPTPDEDVVLTPNGYQPVTLDFNDEECSDVFIESGTNFELADQELVINGDFTIYGDISTIDNNNVLRCYGNVVWGLGSTADFTYSNVFWVYGNWNFNSGANVQLANGTVDFTGSGTSWIRSYNSDCSFNILGLYKGGTNQTVVSPSSTQDLYISGNINMQPNAVFKSQSNQNIYMGGTLYNHGIFDFTDGSNTGGVVFNGSTQSIRSYNGMANTIFNNLTITPSGSCSLNEDGIIVKGILSIDGGNLNTNSFDIELHNNFNNNVGVSGFTAGTGLVDMYGPGSGIGINGNTNFYNLTINDGSGGFFGFHDEIQVANQLTINNFAWCYGTLTADQFDLSDPTSKFTINTNAGYVTVNHFMQGGTIVGNVGTFTANDLSEGGIYGTYNVNSGGEVILFQDSESGQYPDLNANMNITGGLFKVIGGNGMSYWSYSDDVNFTMSDGIVDFDGAGIYLYAGGNALNFDITGGIIRTSGNFWASHANFTPTAGIVELYSNSDAGLRNTAGNYFDVWINKAAKSEKSNSMVYEPSERDIKNGFIPRNSKANIAYLDSDVDINGDLLIDNGVFSTGSYDIYLAGDWTNNVGDAGFNEETNVVNFDGDEDADINGDEIFYNVIVDKTHSSWYDLELNGGLIELHDLTIMHGTVEVNENTDLFINDDLYINLDAGLNCFNDNNVEVFIGGDWINMNTTYDSWIGYYPGTETVTFFGSVDQYLSTDAAVEDFGNLIINKPNGEFRSNDEINVLDNFTLTEGIWHDNVNDLTHYFQGDFYIAEGTAAMWNSFTNNTVVFAGTADQTVYNPFGVGYFWHVIVDKTTIAKNETRMVEGGEIKELVNENFSTSDLLKINEKGEKSLMVTMTSDLDIQGAGSLTIEEGTLDFNGNTFWVTGDIAVNDGGTIILNDDSRLRIDETYGLYINSGGVFETIGSLGHEAIISNRNTGYFAVNIFSGGYISADYTIFSFVNNTGVFVNTGATVDLTHSFNNCTFLNGESTATSGLLVIGNDQTLSIDNATFTDPGGTPPTYNVVKIWDLGHVTLSNGQGDFYGPAYELDNYDRIDWSDFVPGLWTGAVSTDWFTPGNWSDMNIPTTIDNVQIPAGVPNFPVINGIAVAQNLDIEAGAELTINNGSLSVSDVTDINGQLNMIHAAAILHTYEINWNAGSTDNIINGEIHVDYAWFYYYGTDASLDNTSTVVFNTNLVESGIGCFDPDAEIGNLIIAIPSGNFYLAYNNTYSTKISGDLTLTSNGAFYLQGLELDVDGGFLIDVGSTIVLDGVKSEVKGNETSVFVNPDGKRSSKGGVVHTYSDFVLNGTIDVVDGDFYSHGLFDMAAGSELFISGGNFVCDAPYTSGWRNMDGLIDMTSGSFEMIDNNLDFGGTTNITGGTIYAGRTFNASYAGSFQPIAGTVELNGTSIGSYIKVINGNYFNDLVVNRDANIVIHGSSPLSIHNTLDLYSTLDFNDNTVSVTTDVDIFDGGKLQMEPLSVLELDGVLRVHPNGIFQSWGNATENATVTGLSGNYDFTVLGGGTISAEYTIFEKMGSNGIHLYSSANVDPNHSFNNCTFRDGFAGGNLLTINSNEDVIINDAYFPEPSASGYNISKDLDLGSVTFYNAHGGFSGEVFEDDAFSRIHWNLGVDINVMLEGPYNAAGMDTDINGILPLTQPFDVTLPYYGNNDVKWLYGGSETVGAIPGANIVDWVLVELRDAPDAASALPATVIAQQAAFIRNDGSIVDLDGNSNLSFDGVYTDGIFAVIYHRNHLGIMSADPLPSVDGTFTLNFSDDPANAFGGTDALKDLGTGQWGMMSGDADGSGDIDGLDIFNAWQIHAGQTGYLAPDFNLEGQVDNKDKNDFAIDNDGEASQIPE